MGPADSPRVLVVADDLRFCTALMALLESARITVVGCASDAEAGLRLAAAFRPDIVIMDIDMPVMDGVDATRRLRAQHPDVPVILLTGSASSERVEEALRTGAVWAVARTRATEILVHLIREIWRDSSAEGQIPGH